MSLSAEGDKIDSLYRGFASNNRTDLLIGKDNNLYITTDFTKSTSFGSFFLGNNTNPSLIIPAIAAANIKVYITPLVSTNTTTNIIAYPNPTNGKLIIQGLKPTQSIELYNLLGEKLIETQNNFLDMSVYSTGIYILKIDEQIIKIVKE